MTYIIATLGPQSEGQIDALLNAGVDIFRLNLSHNTLEWHEEQVQQIKKAGGKVMLDTGGPEIRSGALAADLPLKKGDRVSLVMNSAAQNIENKLIHCSYQHLPKEVEIDDIIYFDNGRFSAKVTSTHNNSIVIEMQEDAILRSKRHMNIPNIRLSLPILSREDKKRLHALRELGIDYIALSFVRNMEDIHEAREFFPEAQFVAKIECQSAVKNLENIVKVADGIMVARGDLAIETGLEDLPLTQKKIINAAKSGGNELIILATGILKSMITENSPTRAEVNDVANGLWEGANAFLLSDETAMGVHAVKTVEELGKILEKAKEETA